MRPSGADHLRRLGARRRSGSPRRRPRDRRLKPPLRLREPTGAATTIRAIDYTAGGLGEGDLFGVEHGSPAAPASASASGSEAVTRAHQSRAGRGRRGRSPGRERGIPPRARRRRGRSITSMRVAQVHVRRVTFTVILLGGLGAVSTPAFSPPRRTFPLWRGPQPRSATARSGSSVPAMPGGTRNRRDRDCGFLAVASTPGRCDRVRRGISVVRRSEEGELPDCAPPRPAYRPDRLEESRPPSRRRRVEDDRSDSDEHADDSAAARGAKRG